MSSINGRRYSPCCTEYGKPVEELAAEKGESERILRDLLEIGNAQGPKKPFEAP